MSANLNKIERLNITFHRSFSLKRQPMSSICLFANTTSENLTKSNLLKNIQFGTIYAEAYPNYCSGSGLLNGKKAKLTSFGKKVVGSDPTLSNYQTQWLMHYHLSSPLGPGPEFWSKLVNSLFIPGNIFRIDEVREKIALLYWQTTNEMLISKSINSTTSAFINTYIDAAGLGQLKILERITDDSFSVNQPNFRNAMVMAYALSHFWEQTYPGSNFVSLEKLLQSDFPKLFLLHPEDFEVLLNELKATGFLNIHRTAQPYQVVLNYGGDFALNRIYGNE